jgi:putative transposase
MGTELCLEALDNALKSTGEVPKMFNIDQGSQFTSAEWTSKLLDLGIKISWMANGNEWIMSSSSGFGQVLNMRKFIYSNTGTVTALCEGLEKCFERNNTWRPHEVLGNHTPSAVYADKAPEHHQEKVKPPRKVS